MMMWLQIWMRIMRVRIGSKVKFRIRVNVRIKVLIRISVMMSFEPPPWD